MKTLWQEVMNGKTYNRLSDGTYDPPLPVEEVSSRDARLSLFTQELMEGEVARGMTDDVAINGLDSMADIAARDPGYANRLKVIAAQHGYKVKPTDCYLPTIAAFEADPAAFVNHGQGRGHIKRVAEKRNLTTNGMVEHQSHEPETDPHVPIHKLNPRIVKRKLNQKIKENPDLARADKRELVSNIVDTHAPS